MVSESRPACSCLYVYVSCNTFSQQSTFSADFAPELTPRTVPLDPDGDLMRPQQGLGDCLCPKVPILAKLLAMSMSCTTADIKTKIEIT